MVRGSVGTALKDAESRKLIGPIRRAHLDETFSFDLRDIRAVADEPSIRRYECEGDLSITLKDQSGAQDLFAGYVEFSDGKSVDNEFKGAGLNVTEDYAILLTEFHFASQLSDDARTHVVTIKLNDSVPRLLAKCGTEGLLGLPSDVRAQIHRRLEEYGKFNNATIEFDGSIAGYSGDVLVVKSSALDGNAPTDFIDIFGRSDVKGWEHLSEITDLVESVEGVKLDPSGNSFFVYGTLSGPEDSLTIHRWAPALDDADCCPSILYVYSLIGDGKRLKLREKAKAVRMEWKGYHYNRAP